MTATIRSRAEWGARPPKSRRTIKPTGRLYLHHSVTGTGPLPGVIRSIQRYHQDTRGWQDIAYSFLADTLGGIWEGRGALVAGGHTAGYNTTSHAVCAIGDFHRDVPPAKLLEGLARIAAHGYLAGWWTCRGYTGGHRAVASTSCPGDHLNAAIPSINRRVEELIRAADPGSKPAPKPTPSPTPKPGGLTVTEAANIRAEMKRNLDGTNAVVAELGNAIRRTDANLDGTNAVVAALGDVLRDVQADVAEIRRALNLPERTP